MPLISKSKKKGRKYQITNHEFKYTLKFQDIIYSKPQVWSKTKNSKYRVFSLCPSRVGSVRLGNLIETLQIFQISQKIFSREILKSWCPQILKFPISRDPLLFSKFLNSEKCQNFLFKKIWISNNCSNFKKIIISKINNIRVFYSRKFWFPTIS